MSVVLVTGAGGQLATELLRVASGDARVVALGEAELDLRDGARVRRTVTELRPTVIVNAAAYTAVDQAEREAETAYAVNREGAGTLAAAAASVGAFCVHVSTDFVFDGAASTPYAVDAPPNPLSVYGASKLAGELAVRAACPEAAIVRTAWVYAAHGRNFVKTMLRLMAERGEVRVVDDQIGTPTHARGLAEACWGLAEKRLSGLWHWTDAGVASWYDFAVAIAEIGVETGLLASRPLVEPIPSVAFPTPARRPFYSVLDKRSTWTALGSTPPHWREALQGVLKEIRDGQ